MALKEILEQMGMAASKQTMQSLLNDLCAGKELTSAAIDELRDKEPFASLWPHLVFNVESISINDTETEERELSPVRRRVPVVASGNGKQDSHPTEDTDESSTPAEAGVRSIPGRRDFERWMLGWLGKKSQRASNITSAWEEHKEESNSPFELNQQRRAYILTYLRKNGYIKSQGRTAQAVYSLTPAGRQYLTRLNKEANEENE